MHYTKVALPPALLGGSAAPWTERLTGGALLARDLLPPDFICGLVMTYLNTVTFLDASI